MALNDYLYGQQPVLQNSGINLSSEGTGYGADFGLGLNLGQKSTMTEPFKAPDLGNKSMDFRTKAGLGLGIAQTGLNAYLGYQGNKLAKQQYAESKRQFNTNLAMQKSTMAGNLDTQYSTATNPEMLAASKEAYLAKYGL